MELLFLLTSLFLAVLDVNYINRTKLKSFDFSQFTGGNCNIINKTKIDFLLNLTDANFIICTKRVFYLFSTVSSCKQYNGQKVILTGCHQ